MRLWTFQPKEVYNILASKGIFTCDPLKSTMIEFEDFKRAYEWLTAQMVKRIGEKPDKDVLLSDEENWHLVLNDSYIADSEEDFDNFYNHPSEIEKELSWEKIFDVSPFENGWSRKGMFVQATFWELSLSEVVRVISVNKKADF